MAIKAALYLAIRESGISKHELGRRLGVDEKSARKTARPALSGAPARHGARPASLGQDAGTDSKLRNRLFNVSASSGMVQWQTRPHGRRMVQWQTRPHGRTDPMDVATPWTDPMVVFEVCCAVSTIGCASWLSGRFPRLS